MTKFVRRENKRFKLGHFQLRNLFLSRVQVLQVLTRATQYKTSHIRHSLSTVSLQMALTRIRLFGEDELYLLGKLSQRNAARQTNMVTLEGMR